MSAHCSCEHETPKPSTITDLPRYRRILWIALWINLAMFCVELAAGLTADSRWRSRAAFVKAVTMMSFGVFVLGRALWTAIHGGVPEAMTMGTVGTMALLANLGVAWMLYAYREGDANMRSVWLCTRNDAIGNLAVVAAALGVFGTGHAWPDLAVATIMASLALQGGWAVMRQAREEMAQPVCP
jgi:Co/Zn/Cd efflux system component